MYLSLFNFAEIKIKSISITNPINFYWRITNNHMCIVYEHFIQFPIIGHFSKQSLIELNRVNKNRALFKMMSPIKIQNIPCPGLVQLLTQTGCSSGLA